MHNDYLLSVLLGIVEGLTEFLPVSSTAHLRLTEALCHVDLGSGYWKMYSIVIQLGAILCLPIYFRDRLAKFIGTFPKGERGDRTVLTHPLSLVVVAFVVTAVPAFFLSHLIGENLESLTVIGAALLIGGAVMWAVDGLFGRLDDEPVGKVKPLMAPTNHIEEMTLPQAIWIGACQILSAVFPGTSRSMSTIAGGQLVGMSRPSALEFSFFLSIPTMAVATVYDFLKTVVIKHHKSAETLPPIDMTGERWIVLAIGFIVSFFVAWAVVAWFMSWVRRRGFVPFAIYRIILGTAVLIWVARGGGA